MRFVIVLMMLVLGVTDADQSFADGRRVALVIGNSTYEHTNALPNPKNDAEQMSAVLVGLGFETIVGTDLKKLEMDQKVRSFSQSLAGADVAVFYYAGHGLQVGGVNYLVPTDAQVMSESALDFEMIRLDLVQRAMERETKTNILFVDACRNNPLARNLAKGLGTRTTEVSRGLARVETGAGTMISFATQPDNVALDGGGKNSPFASALARHIRTSDYDLSGLMIDVRNDVMRETNGRQVPWDNSALTARFYFKKPAATEPGAGTRPASPGTSSATEWPGVDKSSRAELELFIGRHPGSIEAEYARARLKELNASLAALPPPAPALPPAPSLPSLIGLAGLWHGQYDYARRGTQPAVNFQLTVNVDGDQCSGRIEEPNTFGDKGTPVLYANVTCHFNASAARPVFYFKKTYDGTGGVSHSVEYSGQLSRDGRQVVGQWRIGAEKGPFSLKR